MDVALRRNVKHDKGALPNRFRLEWHANVLPGRESRMRMIVAIMAGLTALAATSTQAAPVPSKAHSSGRLHDTPAENVRKSQWYDHLLSTNPSFRSYRIRKECNPIVNDPELRRDCIGSFDVYEPVRSGYRPGR